ncbi:G5 domain-containing protein [Staphylococcus sp. NRL 16/872]|uniref:G5 domain-containing protein n=1 Tax=Staphylococcus sp. NRL 16/872 TaxID=2930131 RepID=UPI001FB400DF|nr:MULTISPECIES: G5 domain-containing protein [unclassified Staphylococcus]MCJ1657154.1 G5 domain-containing protein [Staphylococcus sp. NRL 21/187]WEN69238.1 G5 domain-containing protein [Staphylococcus sp. NRL 16/872]
MRRKRSKRLDFLPNIQNKYSIRKFSVGVASILVGSTLFLGVNHDAQASESQKSEHLFSTETKATDDLKGNNNEQIIPNKTSNTNVPQSSENSKKSIIESNGSSNKVDSDTKQQSKQNNEKVSKDSKEAKETNKDVNKKKENTDAPKSESKNNKTNTLNSNKTENNLQNKENEKGSKDASDVSEVNKKSDKLVIKSEDSGSKNNSNILEIHNSSDKNSSDLANTRFLREFSELLEKSADKKQVILNFLETSGIPKFDSEEILKNSNIDFSKSDYDHMFNTLLNAIMNYDFSKSENVLVSENVPNTNRESLDRSTNHFLSLVAIPDNRTRVSNWNEFTSAINNPSVSAIEITNDISANSGSPFNLSSGVARNLVIDGGSHTINFGNSYLSSMPNVGSWNLTFQNVDINNQNIFGILRLFGSGNNNHTITFENVHHSGSNLIDATSNDNNVTVNINGEFATSSNDNGLNRSNVGAKRINFGNNANVTGVRTDQGTVFRVSDNGGIHGGSNVNYNINTTVPNPFSVTNGFTNFKAGNNSSIIFGDHTTANLKGQNIFSFGRGDTLDTGVASKFNVTQRGNGNIVDMKTESTFHVNRDAKFIANSDEHRTPGANWEQNNLIGLDGNSAIIVDENATLFLDAKNHQWNTNTNSQDGFYNDLVNINAVGNQTALVHVKHNATLDLRTDDRNFYAEVISIPLAGGNKARTYIFDDAYYVNLQKYSQVVSGQSVPAGSKPNLIFMDPASPGYFQWNGSYIVKTWNPMHFSNPKQHADADHVWTDVKNLNASQDGFNTGIPTYDSNSTRRSLQGDDLSRLNLNYAQRVVLISNNSSNPEATPYKTIYQANPNIPYQQHKVVTKGKEGRITSRIDVATGKQIHETTPPVNEVIDVGNVQTTTTNVAFTTRYTRDITKEVGQPNTTIQEGVNGVKTIKTTYDVNPTTGALTNPRENVTVTDGKEKIISVPARKTVVEPVPFKTIYRDNPNLPAGTEKEIQPGINGQTTTVTLYNVDPTNGTTSKDQSNTTVNREKQDRIVERGTGQTTVTTHPIEPGHKFVPHPDPETPGTGTRIVVTPGRPGVNTTTTVPGKDPVTKVTTPPTDEVIGVDNVDVHDTPVPYNTRYVYNPKLRPHEQKVVQQGVEGNDRTTTTYRVNPQTGELSNPTSKTVRTKEPVDKIVEYGPSGTIYVPVDPSPNAPNPGDKVTIDPGTPPDPQHNNPGKPTKVGVTAKKVVKEPIPFKTIYRDNPNLPAGTEKEIQPGVNGETTKTITYTVDPNTGRVTESNTTSQVTKEKQDRIVERGTGQTTVTTHPIEPGRKYVPHPDPETPGTGTHVVVTPGRPGVNTTTTVPGKDPVTKVTTPPTDEVIGVDNVDVHDTPVPYNTRYVYNPKLQPNERKVVQQGEEGNDRTTTTYQVNPQTGELSNPTSKTVRTKEPVDKIVEYGPSGTIYVPVDPSPNAPNPGDKVTIDPGTPPDPEHNNPGKPAKVGVTDKKVVKEPIPFKTIYRDNPNLPAGVEKEIQPGINGETTKTTTYEVDPNTGQVTELSTTSQVTKEKQDRIVERGTGQTTVTTHPIEPGHKYVPHPDPETPGTGTRIVVTPGHPGVNTTTTVPGKDPVTKVTTPPTDEVIGVDNVDVHDTPVPYGTRYVYNPKLQPNERKVVQQGEEGNDRTTTTYEVNPQTGELSNPTSKTVRTKEPVDKIVEYGPTGTIYVPVDPSPNAPNPGDKVTIDPGTPPDPEHNNPGKPAKVGVTDKKVVKEPIPFNTIYRDNPNLPAGVEKEIQPGVNGETTKTTTYEVDPNTGQVTELSTTSRVTKEKQDRIVERGTGQTTVTTHPIEPGHKFVPHPDPETPGTGTRIVVTPGHPGVNTTTTVPGKDPVTKVTTPPTEEVIGVDNVDVHDTPVPYGTKYVYNPKLQPNERKVVQHGEEGNDRTTTTYEVNPQTGELSNPTSKTVRTKEPVDEIIEYGPTGTIYVPVDPSPNAPNPGDKVTIDPGTPPDPEHNNPGKPVQIGVTANKTEKTPIPFNTIYRNNPNLPVGVEKEIQPGINGETTTVTTYRVDPKTGQITELSTTSQVTKEKQDRIVERGTGQTTVTTHPIEPGHKFVPHPDPETPGTGTRIVVTPGKPGVNTTTTVPGKDPETSVTTPPTEEIIGIDNVDVQNKAVPYGIKYVYNPKLQPGEQRIVQQGEEGNDRTTITYEVNPQTGELSNPTSTTVRTKEPVDEIIEYGPSGTIYVPVDPSPNAPNPGDKVTIDPGTPPNPSNHTPGTPAKVGVTASKTEKTPLPFNTIYRNNPNLPVGVEKEVQPGINGETTTVTTYRVDPKTGQITELTTTSQITKEKQDRIMERGTGQTTVTTHPIEPGHKYVPHPDPETPGTGTRIVVTPGKPGVNTTVKVPGKDPETSVTTPPTEEIIGIDNVDVQNKAVPYGTKYVYNPKLQPGELKVVQQGEEGNDRTTITYEVNPQTGELSNPTSTTVRTKEPVDEIIEYGPSGTIYVPVDPSPNAPNPGDKVTIDPGTPPNPSKHTPGTPAKVGVTASKTEKTPLPFNTIYRNNPNLPVGVEKEVQPGINGETTTVTTYRVDPKTGQITELTTTSQITKEKQDRIVERGTGQTTVTTHPIEPGHKFVPHPDPKVPGTGNRIIIVPGVPGVNTTTTVPGKDPVTKVTTPPTEEVIGVDNVDEYNKVVPNGVKYVYNPKLKPGETRIVQKGQPGNDLVTITYEVNPKTGELSNPKETIVRTKKPIDEIIEYGPKECPITPEEPNKPNKPEKPSKPETPNKPGKPCDNEVPKVDSGKPHEPLKVDKHNNNGPAPQTSKHELPQTGNTNTNSGAIGSLLFALGSLVLLKRNKKDRKLDEK